MNYFDGYEQALIDVSRKQRESNHYVDPYMRELKRLMEQGLTEDEAERKLSYEYEV